MKSDTRPQRHFIQHQSFDIKSLWTRQDSTIKQRSTYSTLGSFVIQNKFCILNDRLPNTITTATVSISSQIKFAHTRRSLHNQLQSSLHVLKHDPNCNYLGPKFIGCPWNTANRGRSTTRTIQSQRQAGFRGDYNKMLKTNTNLLCYFDAAATRCSMKCRPTFIISYV